MKKVLLGMSGGVDSSVAAALLKKDGYDVVGAHMLYWSEKLTNKHAELTSEGSANKCCSTSALENARKICQQLEIPFYVVDIQKYFKQEIVDYMLSSYADGVTPNPCVMCNKKIRFGFFMRYAEQIGCQYVATGHYVSVVKSHDKYRLLRGVDVYKDQSYFLHRLSQEQLAKMVMPLGKYTKVKVKKIASKLGFDVFKTIKESQNLCFVRDKHTGDFLKRHLSGDLFESGPIIKSATGEKIGEHLGLPYYTIGQRKGIASGSGPYYVEHVDKKTNTLLVTDDAGLGQKKVSVRDWHFIAGEAPEGEGLSAKIRYQDSDGAGVLDLANNQFVFDEPKRAVTPGQALVLYRGNECLGGGFIR